MIVLEKRERETSRDYALRVIRENIIRLELAPGSQISENELAAQLGLSRTPVREALLALSHVRIIESYPQRRSVVTLIDYDLVDEACFMRNLMECAVVQQVCAAASEEDLLRLKENIRLQEFYLDNSRSGRIMELDDQFHALLFSIVKKDLSYTLMQNMQIHFDRVRNMALSTVKDLKIVEDHRNIYSAVEQRDPEQARRMMERHLTRYKIDADLLKQKYPDYFKPSTP